MRNLTHIVPEQDAIAYKNIKRHQSDAIKLIPKIGSTPENICSTKFESIIFIFKSRSR